MTQKDFNKDIGAYLKQRREGEIKIVDFERIKRQAPTQAVSELHPNLEDGKVHIIEKEPGWIRKLVTKRAEPENVKEVTETEFEREEEHIRKKMKKGYWSRLVNWIRQEELPAPTPKEFEKEMEELEEKEEEIKESGAEKEEVKDTEKELHKKRSKAIFGFIGRFRSDNRADALREQIFELEEDLKNISKITTNVMKKLPSEVLQEYKKSYEFEKFKEILKKRNLIKEKPKEPASEQQ